MPCGPGSRLWPSRVARGAAKRRRTALRGYRLRAPRHRPDRAVADIEAAFRLALPLPRLPIDAVGTCALAMGLEPEVSAEPVGVTVAVEEGHIGSVGPGVDESADVLASGSAAEWLDTVTDPTSTASIRATTPSPPAPEQQRMGAAGRAVCSTA